MTRKQWPAKDPSAIARYGFNWSPKNLGSDTISSVTCNVISGSAVCTSSTVGEVPNALPGQGTIHRLSGGVDGEICEILLHIVTSSLDEFDQTVYLPIRNQ